MIVRVINVYVKPESVDEFRDATRKNHEGSIREPGVLRFDVLQNAERPTEFVLYEVYTDDGATVAHKETTHYAEWKKTVTPMMAKDRESASFNVVAPLEPAKWSG
jgi:autoinducer 2-degrading protein